MKYFRCERGLAMLETVIALSIMGTLTALAVPKFARSLDNVCVDYEIRCLHSMLHYTQSVSRLSQYNTFNFDTPTGCGMSVIECRLSAGTSPPQYCVRKAVNPFTKIKEYHYLERDVKINNPFTTVTPRFRANGEHAPGSGTITISKENFKRYLVLTNYGRIRMSNQKS